MTAGGDSTNDEEQMSLDERVDWLRERGIEVETPEERRRTQVSNIMNESDDVSYVRIPADSSAQFQELTFKVAPTSKVDALLVHLKQAFASGSVDIDLLHESSGASTLTATGEAKVSEESLRKVALEGHVEVFSLVHATPSNSFTGVNIYLDEAGMLKRLPLNTRATDYAVRAGFNPPPTFYGDVFIGRVHRAAGVTRNAAFGVGEDTALDAPWLLAAPTDNLNYQMELNHITGRSDTQPSVAGTDGKSKQEEGYLWTQTEQELELTVAVTDAKQVKVKFLPRLVEVFETGKLLVHLRLFATINVDGCTWTVEGKEGTKKLLITMEKGDEALWPRIRD